MPALTTTAKENPKSLAPEAVEIYPAAAAGGPTAAEIADEAYRIYLGRGSEHGQDLDDWLEAERRLSPRRKLE